MIAVIFDVILRIMLLYKGSRNITAKGTCSNSRNTFRGVWESRNRFTPSPKGFLLEPIGI